MSVTTSVLLRLNNGLLEFWKPDGSQKLNIGPQDLFFLNLTDGAVQHIFQAINAQFTIGPGDMSSYVKISVQLGGVGQRGAYIPFLFYITTQPNGDCADWWNPPAGLSRVGNTAFLNSTGGNGVTNGRGGVIDFAWFGALQLAVPTAGFMALTDANGFFDCEALNLNKNSFYACVAIPGSGVIVSRQIVSGDYA